MTTNQHVLRTALNERLWVPMMAALNEKTISQYANNI
jgi:hypothetical protein